MDEGGVHSSLHFYRRPGQHPHSQVSGLVKWGLNPADFASRNRRIVRIVDLSGSLACSTSRLIFVGLKIVLEHKEVLGPSQELGRKGIQSQEEE
jgi:hypothetical protein